MIFEWDETKNSINLIKHKMELMYGKPVFLDPKRIDRLDDRFNYGEERRQTIGLGTNGVLFVVYTMRGNICRIISVRYASKNERKDYYGNN